MGEGLEVGEKKYKGSQALLALEEDVKECK
jgi:hypothetical protein